jgi:predicted nucleic acid-binding protein
VDKKQETLYKVNVIVDANIVFSGILNTKGRIGDILINSFGLIDFIAPDFLRTEIRKHYSRLTKISKLPISKVMESEFQVCKDIKFISEEQILGINWETAFELVKEVDENDIHYVAFSKQFDRRIWSGDKQLIRGLKKKGFDDFITTDQLHILRHELKLRKGYRRKK